MEIGAVDVISRSKTKGENLYEVDVLLATFNGESFLGEFLNSLIWQEEVRINLVVSDDGSVDKTLEIIQSYKASFKSIKVVQGPRMGPSQNFLNLLQYSKSQFACFADQDDVWLPHHIRDSIKTLETIGDEPGLVFSKCIQFEDNTKRNMGEFPNIDNNLQLQMFMFQNYARGCTLVFNEKFRALLQMCNPKAALMHDWWSALVALTCGNLLFLNEITTEYRIHSNNFIGIPVQAPIHHRLRRNMNMDLLGQLQCLVDNYGSRMKSSAYWELVSLFAILDSPFLPRLIGVLTLRGRFRSNFCSELYLRIRLLLKH